jgi:ABC-type transport system involved in multi-copper enzyme maturation permease subunit
MIPILTLARVVWLELLRRKDFYVLLCLLTALCAGLLSLDIFGLGGIVAFIKDLGLLAIWILVWILTLNLSVRQLPREESQGTIFPLLAKPISRLELIIGKWLGCWSAAGFATFCFYVLLAGVAALQGGAFTPLVLAQGFILHLAAVAILAALGILLSTRLNSDAAATLAYLISGACTLVIPQIPGVLTTLVGPRRDLLLALYFATPHLELFDLRRRLVHDWGPLPTQPFLIIFIYGVLITFILLALAWLAYRRKRFVRGDIL